MADKKNINALNLCQPNLCPTLFPTLNANININSLKKKPALTVSSNSTTHKSLPNIVNHNVNVNSNKNAIKHTMKAPKIPKEQMSTPENKQKVQPKPKTIPKNKILANDDASKDLYSANSDNSACSDSESEDSDTNENIINVPLITELSLSKKETYHYKIIDKYYKLLNVNNVVTLIDIIEKRSKVSLRLIDWFVTKYSHRYKVRLETVNMINNHNPNNINNGFNVHISYKAQLQSYKKKYFDPFRRKRKLKFKYFFDKEKKISLVTTIGQLNFFKWAFTNNIIEYVFKNYETISKAMTRSNKLDKTKKNGISNSDTSEISDVISGIETVSNDIKGKKNTAKKEPIKKIKKVGLSKPSSHETMSLKF